MVPFSMCSKPGWTTAFWMAVKLCGAAAALGAAVAPFVFFQAPTPDACCLRFPTLAGGAASSSEE